MEVSYAGWSIPSVNYTRLYTVYIAIPHKLGVYAVYAHNICRLCLRDSLPPILPPLAGTSILFPAISALRASTYWPASSTIPYKRERVLRKPSCADRIAIAQHSSPSKHTVDRSRTPPLDHQSGNRGEALRQWPLVPTRRLNLQLTISPEAQNHSHCLLPSESSLPRLNRYHCHHTPR